MTLKNGFELDCVRREVVGDRVRLYMAAQGGSVADDANYFEVAADAVVRVEAIADVPEGIVAATAAGAMASVTAPLLTATATAPTKAGDA